MAETSANNIQSMPNSEMSMIPKETRRGPVKEQAFGQGRN